SVLPSLRVEVVSVPAEGGEPHSIVDGENPVLTADGREILYSLTGGETVMAVPVAGGRSRTVTHVPGMVRYMRVGPAHRVYMMVARSQTWEAWGAPVAGGVAERELPAPWTFLYPAPSNGWRAAIAWLPGHFYRVRLLSPGAALDDSSQHEISSRGSFAW